MSRANITLTKNSSEIFNLCGIIAKLITFRAVIFINWPKIAKNLVKRLLIKQEKQLELLRASQDLKKLRQLRTAMLR